VVRLRVVRQKAEDVQYVVVHGYRRAYRMAGTGPAVVLLHGIGDNSENWLDTIADLSRDHLVIAPDLLGHGKSDKPRADYSIAAYANGLRDLMTVLGIERATIVGHSLGGGVAMQFAYQFPERVERLVLVGAGGAGPEVSPLLRLLSTPFAPPVLLPLRVPFAELQVRVALRALQLSGTNLGVDAYELLRVMGSFAAADGRSAFLRTLRAVVDWRGQVVTMLDRCYLSVGFPVLIMWGERDAIIPVSHAYRAHAAMPGSRLEIFRGAGHFPHRHEPERFLRLIRDFVADTPPGEWKRSDWRVQLIRGRSPDAVALALAVEGYDDVADPLRTASERSAT
jgi:pimeloyl-ACP methyl ester carboxylesterase